MLNSNKYVIIIHIILQKTGVNKIMAGADEENYLDNLLSSVGDEAESNENSESPTSNNNADTYNDDNNTSKETQKKRI